MKLSRRFACVVMVAILGLTLSFLSCTGSKYVERAKKYMDAQMYSDAIEELDRVLAEEPDNPEALYLKGKCCLLSTEFIKAKEHFDRVVATNPAYRKKIADEYNKTGKSYIHKNDLGGAEHCFNAATEYNEALSRSIANFIFSISKEKVKEFANAADVLTLYDMTYKYCPQMENDIAGVAYKAGLSYKENDRIDDALTLIEKSIDFNPDYIKKAARVYMGLAKELGKKPTLHKIKRYLDKAVRYDSSSYKGKAAELYFQIAENYALEGDISDAKAFLDEAARLDEKFVERGKSLLKQLEKETEKE